MSSLNTEQGVSFKMADNQSAVHLGGISVLYSFPSGDVF